PRRHRAGSCRLRRVSSPLPVGPTSRLRRRHLHGRAPHSRRRLRRPFAESKPSRRPRLLRKRRAARSVRCRYGFRTLAFFRPVTCRDIRLDSAVSEESKLISLIARSVVFFSTNAVENVEVLNFSHQRRPFNKFLPPTKCRKISPET